MRHTPVLHPCAITLSLMAILLLAARTALAAIESPHGPLTLDCQLCHTTDNWLKLKDDSGFSHNTQTSFPLAGKHVGLKCVACHSSLVFTDAGSECLDCHADVHRGQFSNNCGECHTPQQWANDGYFRKLHESTRFPLVGVHATLDCQSCHATGQYVNVPTDCGSCHFGDFAAVTDPNHVDAGFPQNCGECHSITTAAWKNPRFAHPQTFPLTGGHALGDCRACHATGFANTGSACVGCHEQNYTTAQNPTHEPGAFPNTCEMCHTTNSWRPAEFENHSLTSFPLTGRHVQAECSQCHVGGQYTGTPVDCWSCHEAEYAGTTNPNHAAANYSHNCAVCHSTETWEGATLDHNLTDFPLTGRHVQTDCAQCHIGGQYTGTPTDCWSCHEAEYAGTTNPNHVTENYPQNCAICHSTESWEGATFDHNLTDFPLTGRHVQTDCAQCHIGGQYTGTPTDCWSCHEANFVQAEGHIENSFPHTCEVCHTTSNWESSFNHDNTQFPLTGRHVQTNCTDCHIGGVFQGTPTDCWSCHEANFVQAEGHIENNFPHTCEVCHTTSNWESSFNHDNTRFPLTGRHVQTNCTDCHIGGVFQGTPTDCWSCHEADYNDAEGHLQSNFPHDCTQCHNTGSWDSDFNHSNTDFPLTGRHVTVNCLDCHVGGQFENTPTDCWFCHVADYNGASPDHNAGYPQECADCHTTNNWDSNFNHDQQYFPIYSGRHRNEWNQCSECHTTAGNFGLFSCIDCHEHSNRGDVDNDHEDVPGYTYTPTSCYACHPDGEEGPNRNARPTPRVKPGRTGVRN